MAHCKTEKY